MIVDIRTALELARVERAENEEQKQMIEDRKFALDIEIAGLEMALSRHDGPLDSPASPSPSETKEWRALTRTDAVVRVLSESNKPMSPREITNVLLSMGRTDKRKLVAAAIQYLKQGKRVHSIGYGEWVAGPLPPSAAATI